jgi:hypothetical protein
MLWKGFSTASYKADHWRKPIQQCMATSSAAAHHSIFWHPSSTPTMRQSRSLNQPFPELALWSVPVLLAYCSIPVTPLEPRFPNYAAEPLMWDAAFRQQLLDGLVELGYAVESAFNDTPQDIEGVWLGGRFAVVQSRPQVRRSAACSCCYVCKVP